MRCYNVDGFVNTEVQCYNFFAFVINFVGFINIKINDGLGWFPQSVFIIHNNSAISWPWSKGFSYQMSHLSSQSCVLGHIIILKQNSSVINIGFAYRQPRMISGCFAKFPHDDKGVFLENVYWLVLDWHCWKVESCTLPGDRLNIMPVFSRYGDFHCKDETAVRLS